MFDLSSLAARTIFALCAVAIGFFLFFPIYWLAISAFKGNAELYRIVPTLWPHAPTLANFETAITRGKLLLHLKNSLIVSGSAAAINSLLAMYAGYSFAKFQYPGRRAVMLLLLSAQVFPFGLLLISLYPMMTDLGLASAVGLLWVATIMPAAYFYLRHLLRGV